MTAGSTPFDAVTDELAGAVRLLLEGLGSPPQLLAFGEPTHGDTASTPHWR